MDRSLLQSAASALQHRLPNASRIRIFEGATPGSIAIDCLRKRGSLTATSAPFLADLRQQYSGPLVVIWVNSSSHGGDAVRAFLKTPGLDLRLVRLPAYSPDFNAD